MNTPIIDPMFFYWLQLVDNLKVFLGIFGGFVFIVCFVFFLKCISDIPQAKLWLRRYPEDKEKKQGQITIWETRQKYSWRTGIFSILLIITAIVIPSKQTLIEMQIAKQVTPHNLNVAGATVDKTIDSIFEKVDKYLDKNEKE